MKRHSIYRKSMMILFSIIMVSSLTIACGGGGGSDAAAPATLDNANLSALTISQGTLTPEFDAETISYAASVVYDISSLTVTPTSASTNATITVNTVAVVSGEASEAIGLTVGVNTITIDVTAEDTTTTKTYTVTVTRAATDTPLAPVASNVTISGAFRDSLDLTGTYTYSDANGDTESGTTLQWLICDTIDGTYTNIGGATALTYTIINGDIGKYIKFMVTPKTTVDPTDGDPVLSTATGPVSTYHLIINEIQVGTTANGDDDEFIEIYNRTDTAIDLAGANDYRLYRSTPTGGPAIICDFGSNTHFNLDTLPSNTTVPAGGYYLVANENASGWIGVTPDALVIDGQFTISADYVVYLGSTTVSSATDGDIVDKVGYGAGHDADHYEGSGTASAIADDKSIQRKSTGQDTNQNGNDFDVLDTPTPTNSGL